MAAIPLNAEQELETLFIALLRSDMSQPPLSNTVLLVRAAHPGIGRALRPA
jgi:hypothetical protein